MKKSKNQASKDAWSSYKKDKLVEYVEQEEIIFGEVTQKQFEDLRFKISNKTLRLVECTNHPNGLSFGFRLHPPHLWNLVEGKLYKKVEGKWVRFIPTIADNMQRMV